MGEVMDFGFIAGMGWGCAFGLAVALAVALWPQRRITPATRPPTGEAEVRGFPNFGERRA